MIFNWLNLILFFFAGAVFFILFIRGPFKQSPLWLMLAAWMLAFGIPRLHLSTIEKTWSLEFWLLLVGSLLCFLAGFFLAVKHKNQISVWSKFSILQKDFLKEKYLKIAVYILFLISVLGLYLFFVKAGNFPLTSNSPDEFRFKADEQVPGLINYTAQLARIYIPLACFYIFWQGFGFKKHWDLLILCVFGAISLILFASRTQIFFIDLWIMALYLFIRKPNLKQAVKFYPIFLAISIFVLAAVPIYRQFKSYGEDYLSVITGIDTRNFPPGAKYLVPIYVGVSFNMQALYHADLYYQSHQLQYGKVTLDPFTNILGLRNLKSEYDLGQIFYSWWNTGTYLFPFVQDFGRAGFFIIPLIFGFLLAWVWLFYKQRPNFLSLNLYAYSCFFMVMSIYLSFTVRAEMYIDLFVLFLIYLIVSKSAVADK